MINTKFALSKIKGEVDGRRNKELYTLIQSSVAELEKVQSDSNSSSHGNNSHKAESDKYWGVLKKAIHPSQSVKQRELALDMIQKLIASNNLRGDAFLDSVQSQSGDGQDPDDKSSTKQEPSSSKSNDGAGDKKDDDGSGGKRIMSSYPPMLIDDIIHCIVSASPVLIPPLLGNPGGHEKLIQAETGVLLQIIKLLLTAITQNSSIKSFAGESQGSDGKLSSNGGGCEIHELSLLKVVQCCANIWLYCGNPNVEVTARAGLMQICHHVFSMLEKVCVRDSNEVLNQPRHSDTVDGGSSESGSSQQMKGGVQFVVEEQSRLNNPYEPASMQNYKGIIQRDAFIILRFLCRLSMKVDKQSGDKNQAVQNASSSNTVEQLSAVALRARSLGLEMLLSVLTNSGPILQSEDPYIQMIRTQITLSISKNSLLQSNQFSIFDLSLSIFLILVKLFRGPLKPELEILFNEIYLYLLEHPSTTYRLKHSILDALHKLCSNPKILADIWLNYDCEVGLVCVFERLVYILTKCTNGNGVLVSQTGQLLSASDKSSKDLSVGVFGYTNNNVTDPTILNERKFRIKALKCLQAIVFSLRGWISECITSSLDQQQDQSVSSPTDGKSKPSSGLLEIITSNMQEFFMKNEVHSNETSPQDEIYKGRQSLTQSSVIVGSRSDPMQAMNMVDNPSFSNAVAANYEDSDRINKMKSATKQGIVLFNENGPKGLKFLLEVGVLSDVKSVADFLFKTPQLNKRSIGDCIGEGKEFNIKAMHAFVDMFDFTNVGFVDAIRQFLQKFRLPGEAQKIDRIMEKFAARYCENNPQIFAKAETAYVLAFSIMMLNTDQHSKSVKHRMTVEDFIRNNRGINDASDLPEDFMRQIFEQISSNEIVLEEEKVQREIKKMTAIGFLFGGGSGGMNSKEKVSPAGGQDRAESSRQDFASNRQKSINLLKKGQERIVPKFKNATHVDYAKSMFLVAFKPVLQVFERVFAECSVISSVSIDFDISNLQSAVGDENQDIVLLCLQSLSIGVESACLMDLQKEVDSLVQCLCKMAIVNGGSLQMKTFVAFKAMLQISFKFGNFLADCWSRVLSVLSLLDLLQLIGDGSGQKAAVVTPLPGKKSSDIQSQSPIIKVDDLLKRRPSLKSVVVRFKSQETMISIDKLFALTARLSGQSVMKFYEAICQVSQYEMNNEGRLYLLQKVVEISHYNMNRIRLEWSQIWKVLTLYFSGAGCHSNVDIAIQAIDALRQLNLKYLDRTELSKFDGHCEALRPFENIMRNSKHVAAKEMIFQSLSQIIMARQKSIQSGWKSIFVVISISTQQTDSDIQIIRKAFGLLQEIVRNHTGVVDEYLVDYVQCVVSFVQRFESQNGESSAASTLKDVDDHRLIFNEVLNLLVESISRLGDLHKKSGQTHISDDDLHFKWIPLFSGFTNIILESQNQEMRLKVMDMLYDKLKSVITLFNAADGQWLILLKKVVSPILNLQEQIPSQPDSSLDSLYSHCIRRLLELCKLNFDVLRGNEQLFSYVITCLTQLLDRDSDSLAQSAVLGFSSMIVQNFKQYDNGCWESVTGGLEQLFIKTLPHDLFQYPKQSISGGGISSVKFTDVEAENEAQIISSININKAIMKCAVHLMVLSMMKDLMFKIDDPIMNILGGKPLKSLVGDQTKLIPSECFAMMPEQFQHRWLSQITTSFRFAKRFNEDYELRLALKTSGVVQKMPDLVKQETISLSLYICAVFNSYRYLGDSFSKSGSHFDDAVQQCLLISKRYIDFHADLQKHVRDINNWRNVVCIIWYQVVHLSWQEFAEGSCTQHQQIKQYIPKLFDLAVALQTRCEKGDDVSIPVSLFMQKISVVVHSYFRQSVDLK
ncbi:hypothetical protein MIR68_012632 [Amoeboaphelidium protococcarum]|nr:hypothetical protein MIR68_012632 [Amoeboaphelidium protococcarum]